MKNCTIAAIAGLAFVGAANAQVVMDFQDLESTGGGFTDHGYSYSANGFTVSHDINEPFEFTTAHTDNGSFYQGSTMLFNNTVDGEIVLTQDNGNPFSIASIDIAALFVGGGNPSFTFVGNLNGGGQVFANYAGTNGGFGGETFSFAGLGFDNLDSLEWTQSSRTAFHQFDNITIVPAPGAFALLGLGGLAAARRRRA